LSRNVLHFHSQGSGALPMDLGETGCPETSCTSIVKVLVLFQWRLEGQVVPKVLYFHIQGSGAFPMEMGRLGCPETSLEGGTDILICSIFSALIRSDH
jgi:hypothetical protein